MRALIALFATVLVGCPPSPVPPSPDASDAAPRPEAGPVPDASGPILDAPMPLPGDLADQACANARVLGCSGGISPNCAPVLRHAAEAGIASGITPAALRCVAGAASRGTVRACTPFFTCPGDP